MEQLRGELGAYGDGLRGHVHLLYNTSAMTDHLPAPLGQFLTDNPQISVDLEERASDDIIDALRAGVYGIGSCRTPRIPLGSTAGPSGAMTWCS